MQRYYDLQQTQLTAPTYLSIGNFDGVHAGHQALLQQMLAAAHQAGVAVETVSLAEESQDEFAAQASVVHVIARPLRTSTGVRWQIQAGEAAYAQVKGPPRRRLVDPSELPSRFPDMRVAIVQAPPDENRDRRSDASYDDAAMLRELAAELALAGVGLVLTAPALPQEVTLAAWKPLSKGLIRVVSISPTVSWMSPQALAFCSLRSARAVAVPP